MIAFLFPGQGVQYPGMMADIAGSFEDSRCIFELASSVCARDILKICMDGDAATLSLTENTQPCLAACELAALAALEAYGVKPDYYSGFSLGEWTASAAAGVFSLEDMFFYIKNRSRFMQDASPESAGGLAAVLGAETETLKELCEAIGGVWLASENCVGNATVAGKTESLDALAGLAEEKGFRIIRLPISVPSHCPLMEPAAEKLKALLNGRTFSAPLRPFAMTADGALTREGAFVKRKLLSQLVGTMYFEKCVRTLLREGVDTFIEIGPGKTLSGFVERIEPHAQTLRVSDLPSLRATLEALHI